MDYNRSSARPGSAKPKVSVLPQQTGDLEEYIQILYEHQKSCEKSGKYLEAEQAKKRLLELKKELEFKSKDEIKGRHFSEKQEIEKAHLDEFNQFNEYWDQKMSDFEDEAEKVTKQTQQRHEDELKQFIEELENSIPQKPKDSAELLSLRKTEESLARQENYMEAHQIQQRILALEREEYEKWMFLRNQKIRNLITQLKTKQNNELQVLTQRIASGKEEQRKVRSQELEKQFLNYLLLSLGYCKNIRMFEKSLKASKARRQQDQKNQ